MQNNEIVRRLSPLIEAWHSNTEKVVVNENAPQQYVLVDNVVNASLADTSIEHCSLKDTSVQDQVPESGPSESTMDNNLPNEHTHKVLISEFAFHNAVIAVFSDLGKSNKLNAVVDQLDVFEEDGVSPFELVTESIFTIVEESRIVIDRDNQFFDAEEISSLNWRPNLIQALRIGLRTMLLIQMFLRLKIHNPLKPPKTERTLLITAPMKAKSLILFVLICAELIPTALERDEQSVAQQMEKLRLQSLVDLSSRVTLHILKRMIDEEEEEFFGIKQAKKLHLKCLAREVLSICVREAQAFE